MVLVGRVHFQFLEVKVASHTFHDYISLIPLSSIQYTTCKTTDENQHLVFVACQLLRENKFGRISFCFNFLLLEPTP